MKTIEITGDVKTILETKDGSLRIEYDGQAVRERETGRYDVIETDETGEQYITTFRQERQARKFFRLLKEGKHEEARLYSQKYKTGC